MVGGAVVVTVWGSEAECDVGLFGAAMARWLPARPAPPGPPPITDPDRLCELVGSAGLGVVDVSEVVCPFTYADEDELVGPLFGTGMGRAAVNRAGPRAVRESILEKVEHRRQPGGSYILSNLFRVVLARPTSGTPVA